MSTQQKVESFNKVNSIIESSNGEQLEAAIKAIDLFYNEHKDDSLLEVLKEKFKSKRQQMYIQ